MSELKSSRRRRRSWRCPSLKMLGTLRRNWSSNSRASWTRSRVRLLESTENSGFARLSWSELSSRTSRFCSRLRCKTSRLARKATQDRSSSSLEISKMVQIGRVLIIARIVILRTRVERRSWLRESKATFKLGCRTPRVHTWMTASKSSGSMEIRILLKGR